MAPPRQVAVGGARVGFINPMLAFLTAMIFVSLASLQFLIFGIHKPWISCHDAPFKYKWGLRKVWIDKKDKSIIKLAKDSGGGVDMYKTITQINWVMWMTGIGFTLGVVGCLMGFVSAQSSRPNRSMAVGAAGFIGLNVLFCSIAVLIYIFGVTYSIAYIDDRYFIQHLRYKYQQHAQHVDYCYHIRWLEPLIFAVVQIPMLAITAVLFNFSVVPGKPQGAEIPFNNFQQVQMAPVAAPPMLAAPPPPMPQGPTPQQLAQEQHQQMLLQKQQALQEKEFQLQQQEQFAMNKQHEVLSQQEALNRKLMEQDALNAKQREQQQRWDATNEVARRQQEQWQQQQQQQRSSQQRSSQAPSRQSGAYPNPGPQSQQSQYSQQVQMQSSQTAYSQQPSYGMSAPHELSSGQPNLPQQGVPNIPESGMAARASAALPGLPPPQQPRQFDSPPPMPRPGGPTAGPGSPPGSGGPGGGGMMIVREEHYTWTGTGPPPSLPGGMMPPGGPPPGAMPPGDASKGKGMPPKGKGKGK